jgi:hypothetical protein
MYIFSRIWVGAVLSAERVGWFCLDPTPHYYTHYLNLSTLAHPLILYSQLQWYIFSRIWVGAVLSAERAVRLVGETASSYDRQAAEAKRRAEEEERRRRGGGGGGGGSRFGGRR